MLAAMLVAAALAPAGASAASGESWDAYARAPQSQPHRPHRHRWHRRPAKPPASAPVVIPSASAKEREVAGLRLELAEMRRELEEVRAKVNPSWNRIPVPAFPFVLGSGQEAVQARQAAASLPDLRTGPQPPALPVPVPAASPEPPAALEPRRTASLAPEPPAPTLVETAIEKANLFVRYLLHGGNAPTDKLPAPLQAKLAEIQASCSGFKVISTVCGTGASGNHTLYVAGTNRVSLHCVNKAADFRVDNWACAQSHLRDWPGGQSVDPLVVNHIHVSYAPGHKGQHEWGVRFVHHHGGGHRYASRHHHRHLASSELLPDNEFA